MESSGVRVGATLIGMLAFFSFSCGSLSAQSLSEPRFTASQYAKDLHDLPEPVTVPKLIDASLELSGADNDVVATDTVELNTLVKEAQQAVRSAATTYDKGNALLAFMHAHVLKQYEVTQAQLNTLLADGSFNCVSSAVLYLILGRAAGLSVEGVSTPDHAFCTVDVGGKLVDVETTNGYGFDPGTKKDFMDAFGHTGFTYVPPGNYQLRTALDDKGLLALILQDRIALLERSHDYSQAVGLAIDRSALLGTEQAYDDGANEIANYLGSLNDARQYQTALSFLDQATTDYGQAPALQKIGQALLHNEALVLIDSGDYDGARAALNAYQTKVSLDPADAASLRTAAATRQLNQEVQTLSFPDAVAAVKSRFQTGDITRAAFNDYVVMLYSQQAATFENQNDYLKAASLFAEGATLTPGDPRLGAGRDTCLQNYAIVVHNQYATLYNQGQTDQALAVLHDGLRAVPGNELLTNDLQKAQSAP